jgi:hypothetical protein
MTETVSYLEADDMRQPSGKPRHGALSTRPALVELADIPEEAEMPFEEGARSTLDPDLRYRMISEAAYHLYQQRGYADGYDLDDWLQAEAQVDHVALKPESIGQTEESSA